MCGPVIIHHADALFALRCRGRGSRAGVCSQVEGLQIPCKFHLVFFTAEVKCDGTVGTVGTFGRGSTAGDRFYDRLHGSGEHDHHGSSTISIME